MYEYLGHPSEELIQVTAETIEEVFIDSARAIFELMTNTKELKDELVFEVELNGLDRSLLLIDWLNRLILLHEMNHVFLKSFDVRITYSSLYNLTATVAGQKILPEMERRLHVKSATYGQLRWNETSRAHQVQFVVDI